MRRGVPSGVFHTACVEFLSVSTSVLLLLFLVKVATLYLASLDKTLSASRRHHDIFGTSCQKLAEKKHGESVLVNGHLIRHCESSMSLSLARSPRGPPSQAARCSESLSQICKLSWSEQSKKMAQHPAKQEAVKCPKRNRCGQAKPNA